MKYIDTSVLISAYHDRDRNHEKAFQFLANIMKRGERWVTSVFSLAEVAGFFSRNHSPENAQELIAKLRELDGLSVVYFEGTREFQNSLLTACTTSGLSAADAIHYLQALSNPEVDELVTFDRDFTRVAGKISVTIL